MGHKKFGALLLLLLVLVVLTFILLKKQADPLFTYIKESTDFTILDFKNLNGSISIDLGVIDDPAWLREDFIKLETKNLLRDFKQFPRRDANEYKSVQIRFLTTSKLVREIATIKVSEQTLLRHNWATMDVYKVPESVDSYLYNR